MLTRLSFKQQLLILLAVPLLGTLAVGGLAYLGMARLHGTVESSYHNGARPMRAMAEVLSRIPRMRVGIDLMFLRDLGMGGAKETATRIRETREEDIPAMQQALQAAVEAQVNPSIRDEVTALQRQFAQLEQQALAPMLQALEQGDVEAARRIYDQHYADLYTAQRLSANSVMEHLVDEAGRNKEAADAEFGDTTVRMLTASAVALLVGLTLGVVILRYLTQRVNALQSQIEQASEHLALRDRSTIGGSDELARIAQAYNQFIAKLDEAVGKAQRFADSVRGTAGSVAEHAGDVTDASQRQTDAAQATAAAVEQVAVSVRHVADNTEMAAQLADLVQTRSREGMQLLEQTRGNIGQVGDTLEDAARLTLQLADRSQSIGGIVNSIRDIADQTNLLALNAAIEAARAGELGRGFAVVADEVRKLAERTTTATGEVSQMLQGIHGEIESVATAMRGSVERMQGGRQLVEQAASAMTEISHEAEHSAENVRAIVDSSREQGQAAESIAVSVQQIVTMADANFQSIKAAQQGTDELNRLAAGLAQEMARFKTTAH
ncbi:methyl-accepting chemotaxis protein [Chitiniphilus eburneus]|uniref:HAMP domain-containing protein n=1 Tax=Chitiniphilus eburneus TaxID=2571148 RepID=A0A4U0QC26_9NEIS|nr:methyl-accepting chemotaxis protein [Chitiniphilus eburneus]TJZ78953.1 HAMP domain-containing protein [Chitiniphilus eburneus]